MFCKKGTLRNFSKFTGKHLCWSLFFNKKSHGTVTWNGLNGEVLRQWKFCSVITRSKNIFQISDMKIKKYVFLLYFIIAWPERVKSNLSSVCIQTFIKVFMERKIKSNFLSSHLVIPLKNSILKVSIKFQKGDKKEVFISFCKVLQGGAKNFGVKCSYSIGISYE